MINGDNIAERLTDAVNQMCSGTLEPKDAKIIVDVLINSENYIQNCKAPEATPAFADILAKLKEETNVQ